MPTFCLPAAAVNKFTEALRSGKIDPYKLNEMTSDQRRAIFKDIVGEEGSKQVNAEFESKMLLKNQKYAYTNWAKSVAGLKPATRRDLMSRIDKMQPILNPADEKMFLQDLASRKLGVGVTSEEAKNIANLSESFQAAEKSGTPLEYGKTRVQLENYVNSLKSSAEALKATDYLKPVNYGKGLRNLMGLTKSVVASFTIHAPFKHGLPALFVDPKNWARNYGSQFKDAVGTLKGNDVTSAVRAEIYSRENMRNGIYDKWLGPNAFSGHSEEFIAKLPSRVPVLGRMFEGSRVMFDSFNNRMRADLVDHYAKLVTDMGLDPQDKQVAHDWGQLAVSQTGGKSSPRNVGNIFLFSERLLKSQFKNLTAHATADVSTAVKVQSAKTLGKMIVGIGTTLAIAHAIDPKSVELDPRSSRFGTIRVGKANFDLTGGMKGLAVLGARLAPGLIGKPMYTKSSTTGVLHQLGTASGQTKPTDLIWDFLSGRASPTGSALMTQLNQQTFSGGKPTAGNTLKGLLEPIPAQDYESLKAAGASSSNTILTMVMQQLGVLPSITQATTKDWTQNPSKSIQAFQKAIPPAKFKQANLDYNTQFDSWQANIIKNPTFKSLPANSQAAVLSTGKAKIQAKVFKDYGFKYHATKPNTSTTNATKSLLSSLPK